MVTCVGMRNIELLLVGINISLTILPVVPTGSPRNLKLKHRILLLGYAWLGGGIYLIEAGTLLSFAVECGS